MRKFTAQQQSWLDLAKQHQVVSSSGSEHFSPFIEDTDITDLVLAFAAAVAAQTPVEKPWYPDDSGEWVELPDDCTSIPEGVGSDTLVEAITYGERSSRHYMEGVLPGSYWEWDHRHVGPHNRIVAYRVVGA